MEVTINYKGVELSIDGNFERGEERVYYDSNGDGFPGSDPYFEVQKIFVADSDINIIDLFHDDYLDDIGELCLMAIV